MTNRPTIRVPVHPGEILREEFLAPYGLSQGELAERLGISRRRINEIVGEKRAITADTALRLATLFRTTPELWMNLQAGYELAIAARDGHGAIRAISPKERRAAEKRSS